MQEVRCASEYLFIRMLCTLLSETVSEALCNCYTLVRRKCYYQDLCDKNINLVFRP